MPKNTFLTFFNLYPPIKIASKSPYGEKGSVRSFLDQTEVKVMKHKLTIGVSNASPKSRVVTYKKVSLEAKVKDVIGNTIFNFIILKLLFIAHFIL